MKMKDEVKSKCEDKIEGREREKNAKIWSFTGSNPHQKSYIGANE